MTEQLPSGIEPAPRAGPPWLLPAGGLALVSWYLLTTLAAPGGADAARYEDWARAFWTGDPFALESMTFSPTGMPLSQWSHGPGLLAVPFVGLFGDDAVRMLGFVLTLGTCWFFVQILLRATQGSRLDALLLFAVALLGTHWGHYALVHSSESLSFFALAATVYWGVVARRRFGAAEGFVLGCGAYLLVLVRVQLAIYYVPVFLWVAWKLWQELDRSAPWARARALLTLVGAALPPLAALIQSGVLYQVMLGSSSASPYVFGDAGFSSFDLAKPELRAVLFHAWHGLLSYHPLYAVVFVALIAVQARAVNWQQRATLASLLSVMALHVLLQAAWYVWWLGTGTYGMRALGLWFIFGVPALATLLRTRFRTAVIVAMIAACLWSFSLLIETAKPQVYFQHYTFRQLLGAQWDAILYCYENGALHALTSAAAAWFWSARAPRGERFTWATASALLYLYVFYVVDLDARDGSRFAETFVALRPALRLAAVPCVPLLARAWVLQPAKAALPAAQPAPRWHAMAPLATAVVLLVATNALFALGVQRMAVRRVAYDASLYRYCSGVQIEEVAASYREYLKVPAFKAKKRALEQFLARLDRRSCALSIPGS